MAGYPESFSPKGQLIDGYYVPAGRTIGDIQSQVFELPHDGQISPENKFRLDIISKITTTKVIVDFLRLNVARQRVDEFDVYDTSNGVIRPPKKGPSSLDLSDKQPH